MADYATASRTKDHFQAELFHEHPEIVSIAPQLKLDAAGQPTKEGIIVIGVALRNPLRRGLTAATPVRAKPIPSKLPAVDDRGRVVDGDQVAVIVEDTGEVVPHMNTSRRRSCPGGFSIGHTRVRAGTLGGNARVGGNFGFILSNNHILAALNTAAIGDPIVQPGPADGGMAPADTIAHLSRFVPINLSGGQNEVDCALAEASKPADVQRNVQSIGTPAAIANGTVGQRIRKSGRSTQLTTGMIVSDNASVQVTYGPGQVAIFVNQLKYSKMCASGDSGSLIWDSNSLTLLGLHFAGDTLNGNDYGNKIDRVIDLLARARTFYDIQKRRTHFGKEDISLVETAKPPPTKASKPSKGGN